MSENSDPDSRTDFNAIIGNVLRYGVIISSVLVGAGVIMILAGDKSPSFPSFLNQLISSNYGKPTINFSSLVAGILSLNPIFIIQLGLLILLATPIVRVAASILLFAAEKDMIYVALTVFVLVVLLFSIFIVGPIEAT